MWKREPDSWAAWDGGHKDLGSFTCAPSWLAVSQFSSRNPASTLRDLQSLWLTNAEKLYKRKHYPMFALFSVPFFHATIAGHCRRQAAEIDNKPAVRHWSFLCRISQWHKAVVAKSLWKKEGRIWACPIKSWLVHRALGSPETEGCALTLGRKIVHPF